MLLPYDTWGQVVFVFIISVLRYIIIGGFAFLLFYVLLKNRLYFKGNYGLYFTWWDRLMNTLHREYDSHFDQVSDETIQLRNSKKQHAI